MAPFQHLRAAKYGEFPPHYKTTAFPQSPQAGSPHNTQTPRAPPPGSADVPNRPPTQSAQRHFLQIVPPQLPSIEEPSLLVRLREHLHCRANTDGKPGYTAQLVD
jgi:hypothetical protein